MTNILKVKRLAIRESITKIQTTKMDAKKSFIHSLSSQGYVAQNVIGSSSFLWDKIFKTVFDWKQDDCNAA